ncbi:hypothetical protein, partial [Salmonella sp. s51884]|uniref:hypothetical protein n=1 Tax=Salmonella sp. s51884 TaxID=3159654 RepID=UPI003980176A
GDNVEDFTGPIGSIRCANSANGVAFVDHKIVKEMITNPQYNQNMKLVCNDEIKPLSSWLEQACQVGNTQRPVVFVNHERSHEYINEISSILTNAVKLSTSKTGPVNI